MKLGPKEIKEINQYLITGRNKQREFVTDDTPTMADGGRIGFKDGMKEMEDKIIFNYKKKRLKELEAGKKPSEIQSYEDYIKTQTEVDMNPGKKKLDKAIADAKKLIKGNTLSAKIPGVESLLKVADNIKGDIAKKKFLTAGFKTLGVAVGAPLVALVASILMIFCSVLPYYVEGLIMSELAVIIILILGLWFAYKSLILYNNLDDNSANRLMLSSFIYLPVTQIVLVLTKFNIL